MTVKRVKTASYSARKQAFISDRDVAWEFELFGNICAFSTAIFTAYINIFRGSEVHIVENTSLGKGGSRMNSKP